MSATGLTYDEATAMREADPWPCVIGPRVVKSTDGASYLVDATNTRHWIPDTDSYWYYARRYPVSGPWASDDVAQIPNGSWADYKIDGSDVANTMICRNDGVCWAVDGGGTRHHPPTYADNVCWRWINGWHVSRNGLNYDQANSLPEGDAWGCDMGGRIVVTNEGAAYLMDGNTRRWIQDTESYYCYADYFPVVRGMSMDEIRPIPEGGWEPRCLSPSRVRNHVVRVRDGTAYFVDGNGWWYWIPNGGIWNCITARHSVLISDATWEQVNSIRVERGVWAYCGQ